MKNTYLQVVTVEKHWCRGLCLENCVFVCLYSEMWTYFSKQYILNKLYIYKGLVLLFSMVNQNIYFLKQALCKINSYTAVSSEKNEQEKLFTKTVFICPLQKNNSIIWWVSKVIRLFIAAFLTVLMETFLTAVIYYKTLIYSPEFQSIHI